MLQHHESASIFFVCFPHRINVYTHMHSCALVTTGPNPQLCWTPAREQPHTEPLLRLGVLESCHTALTPPASTHQLSWGLQLSLDLWTSYYSTARRCLHVSTSCRQTFAWLQCCWFLFRTSVYYWNTVKYLQKGKSKPSAKEMVTFTSTFLAICRIGQTPAVCLAMMEVCRFLPSGDLPQ